MDSPPTDNQTLAVNGSTPFVNANPTTNEDQIIELSRGACFTLVSVLAVALAYHPAGGSLIFGPTSRFWILSPFSSLADALAILLRLGEHVAETHDRAWFYDTSTSVSRTFSLRDAAAAVFIARSLNASTDRRKVWHKPTDQGEKSKEALELCNSIVRDINEGARFRVGVAFPILAQYIKIMAVQHAGIIKALGSIYFFHWLTIEMLITLAFFRSGSNCTIGETSDIATRIDELLFLNHGRSVRNEDEIDENARYNNIFDEKAYNIYVGLLVSLCFASFDVALREWRDYNAPGMIIAGYVVIALLIIVYWRWVLHSRCMLHSEVNRIRSENILTRCKTKGARASAMWSELDHGGPNVGGDTGTLFLVVWIFWCILCFNGKGTQRPDWPWLDWLG